MPARFAGWVVIAAVLTCPALRTLRAQSATPSSLRIVVVEGEDAVNIVQQRSAVAPVVEVRDRNNQPVAGVAVRFAITRGRATFNGARVISVATNTAGRATAAGLTPTGAGTLQISATAALQGQTAAATIVQTNVMTAAQAAAASGSAGASGVSGGSSAAGGGSATGGGLSATTLGIVGGAAAAGTLVAVKALQAETAYRGSYSGVMVWRSGPNQTCSHQSRISGPVEIALQVADDGSVTGSADTKGGTNNSQLENLSSTCPNPPVLGVVSDYYWRGNSSVTGATGNFTFHGELGPGFTINWIFDFTGSLNGNVITGTLIHSWVNVATGFTQGTIQTPISLTKQ